MVKEYGRDGERRRVSFLLGCREVTNAEYALFLRATGAQAPPQWGDRDGPRGREEYPVTEVTWPEAVAYARWLDMRLPTKLEYERAAEALRAREAEPAQRGKDGERPPRKQPTKGKPASGPLVPATNPDDTDGAGPLLHLCGNADEWTMTLQYGTRYYVFQGSRGFYYPPSDQRTLTTGFRLAWPIDTGEPPSASQVRKKRSPRVKEGY